MKFTLQNIALIIFINIVLCVVIWIKILSIDSLNPPIIAIKADFVDFEGSSSENYIIPKSKCITHQTYYTSKEKNNIFQFKNYKECKTVGQNDITYVDGAFKVKCSNNKKPEYGADSKTVEQYGGSRRENPNWGNSLPSINDKQFLFIRCSKAEQYAFVFNHYKENLANKTKEIQKKLGGNEKPMSVLLLVFDSISKYSFERNLPLTKNLLQNLDHNEEFDEYFTVYQFNKTAIPQVGTRPNMAQILYGKSWEDIVKETGFNGKIYGRDVHKYKKYQKNSIWSHFSSLGYVTMFSHSTVFDFVSAFTGRFIKADHVFTNFWRYLWGVTGKHPFMDGQKCFGGKNIHDYLFNYTYQFYENYPNNNKFAYVHSDAAHENTGNLKTIDQDLLRFLNNYLRLIKSRKENLAIFLLSDHGNKRLKNASPWDIRTYFEFNTPFTYLIATKMLVKSLNLDENLRHNEEQLISRFDINLSLKHLAYLTSNISLSSWYPQAKAYYTYNSTVSLFEEKVSFDRTCSEIGVEREHCLCSWYEPVESNEFEERIKEEMIKILTQYLNFTEDQSKKCFAPNKISVTNFIKSKKVGRLISLYKLEIILGEISKMIADFNFWIKGNLGMNEESIELEKIPHSYLKFEEENYFLQLGSISLPPMFNADSCYQ